MICCIFKKIAQNIKHINPPKYNTAILIMAFFLLSAKALWRMRYIPLPSPFICNVICLLQYNSLGWSRQFAQNCIGGRSNVEQGTAELRRSSLRHSIFLIRPARNAFGQIRDDTSMFILRPQLLFHHSVLCMAGGYSAV